MLEFEYLCDLKVDVGEIVTMGPGPLGERRIIAINGGSFGRNSSSSGFYLRPNLH